MFGAFFFQQDAMLKARNDLQLAVTEAWAFNKELLWQSLWQAKKM